MELYDEPDLVDSDAEEDDGTMSKDEVDIEDMERVGGEPDDDDDDDGSEDDASYRQDVQDHPNPTAKRRRT